MTALKSIRKIYDLDNNNDNNSVLEMLQAVLRRSIKLTTVYKELEHKDDLTNISRRKSEIQGQIGEPDQKDKISTIYYLNVTNQRGREDMLLKTRIYSCCAMS